MALARWEAEWFQRGDTLSNDVLALIDRIETHIAEYTVNDYGSLNEVDIIDSFPKLNQSAMFNLVTALNALVTAVGDQAATNSNYAALIRFET